jgi:hypothetical protein
VECNGCTAAGPSFSRQYESPSSDFHGSLSFRGLVADVGCGRLWQKFCFLAAAGAVVVVYCSLGKCNGPSPPAPTPMPLSYATSAPAPRAPPTIAPIYRAPPTIAPMILAPVTPPAPTPTDSLRPTADIESIVSFINEITISSQTIRYLLSNIAIATPEEQVVLWPIEDDRDSAPTNQLALRQRYVWATVWFGSTSWKMPLSTEGTP